MAEINRNLIDSIWDVFWTGGITNSITVLEQMTYLFFMKMLDDAQQTKEASARKMNVEVRDPVFKEGNWHNPETNEDVPYNDLRWHVFKNKAPEIMYRLISRDVFVFIKNLSTGRESAYSKFMRDAVFLIQNSRTLTQIVAGIDQLDMNNRDTMGDVYEYILGKMAASGTNGQFRTPRHIIRMMVELIKPTLKDVICDPAMGSAGFIVESAKYIRQHYVNELLKRENAQHYRTEMLHGFDTDATMLRIGAMNLMLHGVDNPDIAYRDSLSIDNTDVAKYTLCLANPPFSGSLDKNAVSRSLHSIVATTKTELLFLALFIRMLRLGGRCASIVPDGVLFGASKAHKSLRKELVDNQRLQAVISMPSGVFKPYAGVSTAVLVFTKINNPKTKENKDEVPAGGTDQVWFYDMKADGFSLDDRRDPIQENDIPDVIRRFNDLKAEEKRTRKDQSFLVPVKEIRENDYDLSVNKYKETEYVPVEYPPVSEIMSDLGRLSKELDTALKDLKGMLDG